MGSNVSANTLFHFTNNIESIINILVKDFSPRYCMENMKFIYKEGIQKLAATQIAIPMVCFCDIPLSQIGNHVQNYGPYAIGLSKRWAEDNGINPVMYELPDSNAVSTIRECLHITIPCLIGQNLESQEVNKKMMVLGEYLRYFLSYLKPYEGQKWDGNGFTGDIIRFYDEREWRYIPEYIEMTNKSLLSFILKEDFVDIDKRIEFNAKLENNFKLKFEPKDIKYIIVKNEEEVLRMVQRVNEIKTKYSYEDVEVLKTKIISMELIREDF